MLANNTVYYAYEDEIETYLPSATASSPVQIIDNVATITNTYSPNKTITVNKTVTGNMGSKDKKFTFSLTGNVQDITCTLNGNPYTPSISRNTITFQLEHDDSLRITVPGNQQYTLSETDYSAEGYQTYLNNSLLQVRSVNFTSDTDKTFNFTNNRDTQLVTGIKTTIKASIAITSLSLICFILMKLKKHLIEKES